MFTNKKNKMNGSVSIAESAKLIKANSVRIENCTIRLENNAQLILGENVSLKNYNIHVINGLVKIEAETILSGETNLTSLYVEQGNLHIADHCVIQAEFCIRYNGECSVGSYTGIMQGTEIRCDEQLEIGSFNMISYECMIYDTNTHVQYSAEERRKRTMANFPNIGAENEKPNTAKVSIGNDCWLGKRAVVLKGVNIGDNSTIATNAVVTKSCHPNTLAIGNPAVFKTK